MYTEVCTTVLHITFICILWLAIDLHLYRLLRNYQCGLLKGFRPPPVTPKARPPHPASAVFLPVGAYQLPHARIWLLYLLAVRDPSAAQQSSLPRLRLGRQLLERIEV